MCHNQLLLGLFIMSFICSNNPVKKQRYDSDLNRMMFDGANFHIVCVSFSPCYRQEIILL